MTLKEALKVARPYVEDALDVATGRAAAHEQWPERHAEFKAVADRIASDLAAIDDSLSGNR